MQDLGGQVQTFFGRDGDYSNWPRKVPPRLAFQITAANRFAIRFADCQNRFHEAVADELPLETVHWYNLAATSDGQTLRLYVDLNAGQGYRLQAQTTLPKTGSTALGCGANAPEWSIGRGWNSKTCRTGEYFEGWIDEVRISDVAREPSEFLFSSRDQGNGKKLAKR